MEIVYLTICEAFIVPQLPEEFSSKIAYCSLNPIPKPVWDFFIFLRNACFYPCFSVKITCFHVLTALVFKVKFENYPFDTEWFISN